MDMHEFYMGNVFDAYDFFGAHPDDTGTVFPNLCALRSRRVHNR